jgi:hypothetical protein
MQSFSHGNVVNVLCFRKDFATFAGGQALQGEEEMVTVELDVSSKTHG